MVNPQIKEDDIQGLSSHSYLGGPTMDTVRYQGKTYNLVYQPGENRVQALSRVLGAGQSDVINADPVTGLVGPGNVPIRDWASQVGGSPDTGEWGGGALAYGKTPPPLGGVDYTLHPGETMAQYKSRIGSAGYAPETLTKDQFTKALAVGSNPANVPFKPEASTGYDISRKIQSLIPPSRRALSPDAGAPFPNLSPTPPEFSATSEERRLATAYGLDQLQSQADQIDNQIIQIQNDLLTKQENISAAGGISSRVVSKEMPVATKAANQQLRDLRLQRTELTRQISTANKGISMMMSAEKTDYNNAKRLWTNEYNKNIQYYNSLDKESTAQDKQDKATLQGMLNMLATGKTNISELTPEAQNTIDELILKTYGPEFAGFQNELPDGMAIYRKSFTGADGKKYLQSLYMGGDGTFRTEYTTPITGTKTSGQKLSDSQSMAERLKSVVGTDGRVSPENWKQAMDAWVGAGYGATSFASQFKNYTPGELVK